MWIIPHSPQLLRGCGTTRAESCFSSLVMNNRSTCWGLSRLPSLTSFSGLWKCFTIPLIASPTPSWIWPVFNSGWEEKRQTNGQAVRQYKQKQAREKKKNPIQVLSILSLCFLIHAFEFLPVMVLRTRHNKRLKTHTTIIKESVQITCGYAIE